jgi:predicted metal-dependent phosphoesterase TrpH
MPGQRSTSSETVYADLHTHTHCSDGTHSPDALVRRAAEGGVQVLSVTDHDTTAGLETARAAAHTHGVRLVNGVELSAEVDGHSVHLLGYGFDPTHSALKNYLSDFTRRRQERLDQMIGRLAENGVEVSSEAVDQQVGTSASPGRPHLARALVEEGHVDSCWAAFEQYLGADQPAHIPAPTQPAAKAIEALHVAGGVAVLAHPGQWTPGSVLTALRDQGLDGIECVFPSHPDYLVDYYQTICRSHDLLVTGGSDDHGGSEEEDTHLGTVGLTKKQWERFRDSAL